MYGMWRYRLEEIELDMTKGDCWHCNYAGTITATITEADDYASWICPSCNHANTTEMEDRCYA